MKRISKKFNFLAISIQKEESVRVELRLEKSENQCSRRKIIEEGKSQVGTIYMSY